MNPTLSLFRSWLIALVGVAWSVGAFAGIVRFDPAAFERAVAAGQPVVVHFHADWCTTCRAQDPIVRELSQAPALKALTIFVADYDTERALKKTLKVTQQSTFVVFKGGKEVARSTGQTQRAAIEAVFAQAL